MISAILACFSAIAANEIPCAPSVKPKTWPVSSLGRKPLGILTKSQPVATSTTAETTIVERSVAQRPAQRPVVEAEHRVEPPLGRSR